MEAQHKSRRAAGITHSRKPRVESNGRVCVEWDWNLPECAVTLKSPVHSGQHHLLLIRSKVQSDELQRLMEHRGVHSLRRRGLHLRSSRLLRIELNFN